MEDWIVFFPHSKAAIELGKLRVIETHPQEIETNLMVDLTVQDLQALNVGQPVCKCAQEIPPMNERGMMVKERPVDGDMAQTGTLVEDTKNVFNTEALLLPPQALCCLVHVNADGT
jgi:hypothetical protein